MIWELFLQWNLDTIVFTFENAWIFLMHQNILKVIQSYKIAKECIEGSSIFD